MVARKQIDPELLAEAKRLYEQTLAPVDDICGMLGISRPLFYRRAHEENWRGRRAKVATFQFTRALSGDAVAKLLPAPIDQPRAEIVPAPKGPSEEQRLALALKFHDAVVGALEAIQRISSVIKPADHNEIEKIARASACVTRSLREIQALAQPETEAPADDIDDDPIPQDIDEFRDALAARIRGIIDVRRARRLARLERSDGPGRPDALYDEPEIE